MPDAASAFQLQREQLVASLLAVTDSMRNAANMAESFAKIVGDLAYSTESADLLNGKGKGTAEDDGAPKKRKRNTKPKDPFAPKRPASSYIMFQNEVRTQLKLKHPNLSNSDLLGMISEQWKNMTEQEKETYIKQMQKDKDNYIVKKRIYDNRTPEEIEADNAAAAAALALKKANAKPRGPKAKDAAAAAAAAGSNAAKGGNGAAKANGEEETTPATRASTAAEESGHSSDGSDEESDGEEDAVEAEAATKEDESEEEQEEDEEEQEEEQPPPKKRRLPEVQTKEVKKDRKASRA